MKTLALGILAIGMIAASSAMAQAPAAATGAPAPTPAVSTSAPPAATPVSAPSATSGAAKKFSSASTLVDVMNNPAAKAVLGKILPDAIPVLEMFIDQIPPETTVKDLPDLSMGMVTDDQVKQINDELVKI